MAPPTQFTSWLGLHCLCPECLQPWIFSSLASVLVSVSLGFSHHTCHQCWQQQRAPDTSPNSEQVQGLLSAPRKNQVLRGKPAFFTVCPQNLCLPPWGAPGPSQVPAIGSACKWSSTSASSCYGECTFNAGLGHKPSLEVFFWESMLMGPFLAPGCLSCCA